MSSVETLMRSANPVPDVKAVFSDDEIHALLLRARTRSAEMDMKEVVSPVKSEKHRRSGWLVAAAAFGAIVLVVGAVYLLRAEPIEAPAEVPVSLTTAPVVTTVAPQGEPSGITDEQFAVIAAYEDAINAGDVAAFRALHDPGATQSMISEAVFTNDLDSLVEGVAWFNLLEGTVSLDSCELVGDGVACIRLVDGPIASALYGRPMQQRETFFISDGFILATEWRCLDCPLGSAMEANLAAWIRSQNAEDAAILGQGALARRGSPEEAALWVEYARRWVEAGRP